MNPYVEEVLVVTSRIVNGAPEIISSEKKIHLTPKGKSLVSRLVRLRIISQQMNYRVQGIGCFCGSILCIIWGVLLCTQPPIFIGMYKAAQLNLPYLVGMILLSDLMPFLWMLCIGMFIGLFWMKRPFEKADKIRLRILYEHPQLHEAVKMCRT